MTDKTETVSVRMTPEMREELNDWADDHGYSEPEAVREMVRQTVRGQDTLREIRERDEIMERLECIEQEIREIDRGLWATLFS